MKRQTKTTSIASFKSFKSFVPFIAALVVMPMGSKPAYAHLNQGFLTAPTKMSDAPGLFQTTAPILKQRPIPEMPNRDAHARELLGRSYSKSAANLAAVDESDDFKEFIQCRISNAFKDKPSRVSRRVYKAILQEADKYKFDPVFLMAVIENESSFNPLARGTSGEIGLMQILPRTGEWIAKKSNIAWKGDKSLQDPVTNIRLGAAYLAHLRNEFNSHGKLYLAAYNMGSTNVQRALAKQIQPKEYSGRVMQRYMRFYAEYQSARTSETN